MAPSRTIGEQAEIDRPQTEGVSAMDFATGSEVTSDDITAAPRTSKTADVIAMLQRDSGATLPKLVEATGWLPHTTRAALTGLRKKGHAIARGKRDELTCYTLGAAAEA